MHKAVQSWAGLHRRFKSFELNEIGDVVLVTDTENCVREMVLFSRDWWLLATTAAVAGRTPSRNLREKRLTSVSHSPIDVLSPHVLRQSEQGTSHLAPDACERGSGVAAKTASGLINFGPAPN
jgi:hypothetical protein